MIRLLVRYSFVLAIAWFLIILIFCATPGKYIPSVTWLELLSFDKFVHASIFFILETLILISVVRRQGGTPSILASLLFSIAYGMGLEWMQANVVTGRSPDVNDIIANSFGCLMALLMLRPARRWVSVYGVF